MVPLDDALEALADHRRRRLLLSLRESESPIETVSVPEDLISGTPTDGVRVAYTHVHLPMLEEMGYVHWDRRHHEVSEGPQFDELGPLLDVVEEYGDE